MVCGAYMHLTKSQTTNTKMGSPDSYISKKKRAINIMDVLKMHLPSLLRPFIYASLKAHFEAIPRTAAGLLADSQGEALRFDPDTSILVAARSWGSRLCLITRPTGTCLWW